MFVLTTIATQYPNKPNAVTKKKYYELGGIPVKPYKLYKYTSTEMAVKMIKTEHWGPWDLKPPR